MAKSSKKFKPPPPIARQKLFPALGALLVALVLLMLGYMGFAGAFFFAGIGLWLHTIGKHRKWAGAPEVGLLLVAIGVVIALVTLF